MILNKTGIKKIVVGLVFAASASAALAVEKCELATPSAAQSYCNSMNAWDIAAVQGTTKQFGPGYNCKQETYNAGIGHALCDAGGSTEKRVLANPTEAKNFCYSMGYWDIAAIQGTKKQFGPGYNCKQEEYNGGIGHALVK